MLCKRAGTLAGGYAGGLGTERTDTLSGRILLDLSCFQVNLGAVAVDSTPESL